MDQTLIEELHATLTQRRRPEDVAEIILAHDAGALTIEERETLDLAARHSFVRMAGAASGMANTFFSTVTPGRQVATALDLFRAPPAIALTDSADPALLKAFAASLAAEIQKAVGASSFKTDRLNRAARRSRGLEISRRRYNKLFRFLRRFEAKIATYERQLNNVGDQMVAKSGIATRIPLKDLAASPEAACFVAYYAARRNRRSVFTNTGQDPAYDEIAEMLLGRLRRAPRPEGWRAVAYVMPTAEVMAELSERDRLALLADWLETLRDIAARMAEIWEENRFDRAAMVVAKGNDSSAWNGLAGAWNMARQGWLSTLEALGMEDLLDLVCLGKAMRLMAGDVAAWHGGLHPDTAVWAELPPPWEVLLGEATCTRAEVEIACARHDLDPVATGWVAARRGRRATAFRPTPELVHGVVVSHPELGVILRKANWFSGKPARPLPTGVSVQVDREDGGWALRASWAASALQRLLGRDRRGEGR